MSLHRMPILALALLAGGCAQSPLRPVTADTAATAVQAPAGQPFEPWLQAERARVAQQRAAAQQRYHDEELACWRRFAVNDCLSDAKRQRRNTLDGLRQQDLQLNALEREQRTAGRLRVIEQKAGSGAPVVAPSIQGHQ
ncbi:MAG: hypothetical protein R3E52_04300 [Burkholderiaceae bacterium]